MGRTHHLPADLAVTGEWSMTCPLTPRAVGLVRRRSGRALDLLGWPGDRDAAVLVVSELATNAVVHAAAPARSLGLRLAVLADGALLVDVSDPVPGPPDAPDTAVGPDAEGGRGLALVRALAALSWLPGENGKTARALLVPA
ncbi:ATP-binding protein [Streptomyces sp. JNUCC 64]